MKLINVGRSTGGYYIPVKDLIDFRRFMNTNPIFNGSSSWEWGTFDLLLGSHLVTK
jgi:hypothetical protein